MEFRFGTVHVAEIINQIHFYQPLVAVENIVESVEQWQYAFVLFAAFIEFSVAEHRQPLVCPFLMECGAAEDIDIFCGNFVLTGHHRTADKIFQDVNAEFVFNTVLNTPADGEVGLSVKEVIERSACGAQVHAERVTLTVAEYLVRIHILEFLIVLDFFISIFHVGEDLRTDCTVVVFEHVVADGAEMEQGKVLSHNHLTRVRTHRFPAALKCALPVALAKLTVHLQFGLEILVVEVVP